MKEEMAAKRRHQAERAKGTAAEENEERKRIFDFIDSFRYTGVSRRGNNGSKTFVISKKDTDTDTDTGHESKPTPPPPTTPSPPLKKCTRKRSVRAVAVAPDPVGAVISKARKQLNLPRGETAVSVPVVAPTRKPRKSRVLALQWQVIRPETPIATVAVKSGKTKCRSTLTAAEKVMEAYRRVPPGFKFTPPHSSYGLLQEEHAFDPWRVLIICMLLNNTTGAQVRKVIDDLFALCPDAETTLAVDVELIEHVIRSLGLQNKRARMIKILSEEYLDPDWTHVTFLHGVGKYAADAYAIFCTGKGADVRPDDHKLVDYWNSIYGNSCSILPQSGMLDFWSDED